jgi:hypothetical protein
MSFPTEAISALERVHGMQQPQCAMQASVLQQCPITVNQLSPSAIVHRATCPVIDRLHLTSNYLLMLFAVVDSATNGSNATLQQQTSNTKKHHLQHTASTYCVVYKPGKNHHG